MGFIFMTVSELLDIKNSKIGNREKGLMIAKMAKACAKRHNPIDTDIPSGWNAGPFPGSQTDHTR